MGRVSRLEGRLLISQVRTSPRVQEGPNPIPCALVTGHNHPGGRTPRHWTQRLPPRPPSFHLIPPSWENRFPTRTLWVWPERESRARLGLERR